MTNADCIRAMTDEQLADFLFDYVEPCHLCAFKKTCSEESCEAGRLAWLREQCELEAGQ